MSSLTTEIYACILARLACRRGARVDVVLSELGIDPEAFRQSEPALRAELTEAWPRRKGIFAMKFATAFGEELTRLGPLATDGPSQEPDPAPASRQPDVVIPSYLREPQAPASSGPVALPSAIVDLVAAAPDAAKPSLAGTMDADLSTIVAALRRGALPFAPTQDAPAPPAPPPPSISAPRPPAPSSGATLELPASPGPEEPDFSALPLEVYAAVTGALARGESREAALAQQHLSAEAFDRLAKAWALRFAKEPHLLARFQDLARSSAGAPRRSE